MQPAGKRISHAYLICATPRTGSTLLQEALQFTKVAGNPLEYFGLPEAHWLKELKDEPGETYVEKVLAAGTTENGVFGAKVLGHQFRPMIARLRAHCGDRTTPVAPFLRQVLPDLRYILVRRADKLGQAVSAEIAQQTAVWHQVEYDRRKAPAKEAAFDYDHIGVFVRANEAYDRQWQDYFAANAITPLVLDYEDLATRYVDTVYKVLAFLDLPTNVAVRRPRLEKQADERSREWMERYRTMSEQEAAAGAERLTTREAFEQAIQHHKHGRTREAEALYLAVLRAEPDHLDGLHNLGLLRLEEGKAEAAEALLAKVLENLPNSPRLLNNYGVALDTLKRHEDAARHFRRALDITPAYPECHNNLGNALQLLGRYDDAVAHYECAVSLRPDYVDAHRNLGRALLNRAAACRARARAHFEKSLALKPGDAEAYCGLGMAHQAQGEFDESVTCFAKAIAIDPGHVEARQHLEATIAAADRQARAAGAARAAAAISATQLVEAPDAERGAA